MAMQINTKVALDKDKLDYLLSHVNCGVGIINQDGDFLMTNKYFSDMLGYTLEEMLNQNCIDMALPQYQEENRRIMEEVNLNGEFDGLEKECSTKDHKTIWISMNIIKIDDNQFLIISNDITLEKELEKKVELRTLELKALLSTLELIIKDDTCDKDKYKELITKHTNSIEIVEPELWVK